MIAPLMVAMFADEHQLVNGLVHSSAAPRQLQGGCQLLQASQRCEIYICIRNSGCTELWHDDELASCHHQVALCMHIAFLQQFGDIIADIYNWPTWPTDVIMLNKQ